LFIITDKVSAEEGMVEGVGDVKEKKPKPGWIRERSIESGIGLSFTVD
jgi:hypothetical protein